MGSSSFFDLLEELDMGLMGYLLSGVGKFVQGLADQLGYTFQLGTYCRGQLVFPYWP
jgi:hypothetical protein